MKGLSQRLDQVLFLFSKMTPLNFTLTRLTKVQAMKEN